MNVFEFFKKISRLGGQVLRQLADKIDLPQASCPSNHFLNFYWPGHFYSPIPDPADVELNGYSYFNDSRDEFPGIDLNVATQLATVARLVSLAAEYVPASDLKTALVVNERFFLENGFYESLDAFVLYGMLRMLAPQQVFEVGSGFSSALILDVSNRFLSSQPKLTFVEPNTDRLLSLLRSDDKRFATIIPTPVQQLDPGTFYQLGYNDILFIDSSHVSKIGSDVNYLMFEVLPRLKPGVVVHIHDIFWPFEYPEAWFREGRCWNELYLVRTLLSAGRRYEILHFNSYLFQRQSAALSAYPSWAMTSGGGSIWLRVR